jgi:microcystin-dependent protein
MDPLLGEIRLFAGNYAPVDWALCNGQQLSISQHTALFSIIGTTYGGNGSTTFNLPDLRGRFPLGVGMGPGLSRRVLGEQKGSEIQNLTLAQIPTHSHAVSTSGQVGSISDSGATVAAGSSEGSRGKVTTSSEGQSQPHNNMPPYLGVNYIIALVGIYPMRP